MGRLLHNEETIVRFRVNNSTSENSKIKQYIINRIKKTLIE